MHLLHTFCVSCKTSSTSSVNTLRPRQNGRHFPDDIFKCIFLNENVSISIKISLKFVPKGPINNIPALVQIMAWRRSGDKPLSEPMMVSLPTHICVARPQWVKHHANQHPKQVGMCVVVLWLLTSSCGYMTTPYKIITALNGIFDTNHI